MASESAQAAATRAPWYARWFSVGSRRARTASVAEGNGAPPGARAPVALTPSPLTYRCDLCGVTSKSRNYVFDHLKAAHRDVMDRNGHIVEERDGDADNNVKG